MNEENFANFIANPENNDWTLRIRIGRKQYFEDIESFDALTEFIKRYEGETLRIKLFCGNDEWGPIEEGRAGYVVYNGRLCQSPELKFEIRNCVGLAQYYNERQRKDNDN